jgi:hypothetical protein
MIGQLYLINTRGRLKNGDIETASYIITATSKEDIEIKLAYFIDKSNYRDIAIKNISRIKPNFHLLSRDVLTVEKYFENKEMEAQIRTATTYETPTLQTKNKDQYAFGLIGNIQASCKENALIAISKYLFKKAKNKDEPMPFNSGGKLIIEEIGESDSFGVSGCYGSESHIDYGGTKIFQGGKTG